MKKRRLKNKEKNYRRTSVSVSSFWFILQLEPLEPGAQILGATLYCSWLHSPLGGRTMKIQLKQDWMSLQLLDNVKFGINICNIKSTFQEKYNFIKPPVMSCKLGLEFSQIDSDSSASSGLIIHRLLNVWGLV